ncbi:MAG: DUF4363 family protein [Clostridia bacterium]|nr:DUF4363 family protein [Clostridia bacterium]
MKRTMVSLILIILFILAVVLGDLWFMSSYAEGMNDRLDALLEAKTLEEKKSCALDLDAFFEKRNFWAHRLVPTGRMEELETLLHKLNAYLKTDDAHEVEATVAEIRSRVNLLYSTAIYHWHHPTEFCIE